MNHTHLLLFCSIALTSCSASKQGSNPFFGIIVAVVGIIILRFLLRPNPIKKHDLVHSHHSHHFEDFQMSAQEFYQTLKDIIFKKSFPNVEMHVSAFSTGGILDPYRDYLEIRSDNHIFYVCAAPYGKNFFISYWLKDTEEDFTEMLIRKIFGGVPQKSFFEIDSETMFVESIKKAIMVAIEETTQQRGLRKPTLEERTPTIHT